jgi:hypothetical protein
MFMGAGESRADGSDWHIECRRSLAVAQFRPIAEGNNLLFLSSEYAEPLQYLCHLALVVQPASRIVTEVICLALVTAQRPVGITDDVVGHCQEPRQDGVSVEANRLSVTPRFEKDNARQFFGARPRSRATETMDVDGVGVALE